MQVLLEKTRYDFYRQINVFSAVIQYNRLQYDYINKSYSHRGLE